MITSTRLSTLYDILGDIHENISSIEKDKSFNDIPKKIEIKVFTTKKLCEDLLLNFKIEEEIKILKFKENKPTLYQGIKIGINPLVKYLMFYENLIKEYGLIPQSVIKQYDHKLIDAITSQLKRERTREKMLEYASEYIIENNISPLIFGKPALEIRHIRDVFPSVHTCSSSNVSILKDILTN